MAKIRIESDSLGKIQVAKSNYWGAQTERARLHFAIGKELMPQEVIYALAYIKKAAALANNQLKNLSYYKTKLIVKATDEIIQHKLDQHFPLSLWQSGSGTQTNMNVNEVIANRAIELAKGILGSKNPIHPNDDVNKSQSTNDVFPCAMQLATLKIVQTRLIPSIKVLHKELHIKQLKFNKILKIGRTHLQDAVPLTLGQEFSGYVAQIDNGLRNIELALENLKALPLGGTAVGTGINAPKKFSSIAIKYLKQLTKLDIHEAKNKFSLLAAHDAFVNLSGALKTLACALIKIANDIRWMNSGPHCGLGELILPANEPGSSIMPGKINPTQCEMLTMIGTQIIGNDAAITFAASQGNFELNAFKPVIIFNLLQAINLLNDGCQSFVNYALKGLTYNPSKIKKYLQDSLMTVTLLNPIIGYDQSAKIVQLAIKENISWQAACAKLKILSASQIQKILHSRHSQLF